MNFLSRRRTTPVEVRKYRFIFVIVAGLLALSTGWAVVDEVWIRRPWKQYQKQFNDLELQKAKEERKRAEEKFSSADVQSKLLFFQEELRQAELELQSAEYRREAKELEEIELHLSELAQQLQVARSESDEIYYRYKSALHREKRGEKEKIELDQLEEKKKRLTQEISLVQEKRRTLETQVRQSEHRVETLRDSLIALQADIHVWKKRIEVIEQRPVKVKQIVLPGFDSDNFGGKVARVERCITCHLAVERPGFEKEKEPFARHSYIIDYHPVGKFACTSCHGGQAVGLTVNSAHGKVEFWADPLLGEGARERLCGKCHLEVEFPEAPTLTKGRRLFETSGCLGCHNVEGYVRIPNIGPSLNHIAAKVKPSWLLNWLRDPKQYLPRTKMPNFKFSEEETKAVASYLLATSISKPKRRGVEGRIQSWKAKVSSVPEVVEEGKTLFGYARCLSCHSLDGAGGTLAPDLGKIATKVRPEWLFEWIRKPHAYQPNTKMPQYRFTDEQIRLLVAYLSTLGDSEPDEDENSVSYGNREVRRGEKLVNEYGCLGCHDPVGQETIGGKVGADLTFFGDKGIENFDFGDLAHLPRSKEAWTRVKLENSRIFSTERIQLKMPDFGFNEKEAEALTTVLLGFTEDRPPQGLVRERKAGSAYEPPGEFGRLVRELNCLTCHKINGRGGTMAPDLSYEGSRANAEWLRKFLRNPTTLRPSLVERMPKFYLPEKEIELIVNYMKVALVNNEIPSDFLRDQRTTRDEIEGGRKLYHEKYRCQSCHQISYEGGTMGPELVSSDTSIRERRPAGWIYNWIKNPSRLDPTTVEPNHGLSDEEALLITKYLLSY